MKRTVYAETMIDSKKVQYSPPRVCVCNGRELHLLSGVVEITLMTDGKTSKISVAKLVADMINKSNRIDKPILEVRVLPLVQIIFAKFLC